MDYDKIMKLVTRTNLLWNASPEKLRIRSYDGFEMMDFIDPSYCLSSNLQEHITISNNCAFLTLLIDDCSWTTYASEQNSKSIRKNTMHELIDLPYEQHFKYL